MNPAFFCFYILMPVLSGGCVLSKFHCDIS